MLPTLLAALTVFGLVVLGMSVGALLQGRRLRGSCGGTGHSCTCSALQARHCARRREQTPAS